MSDFAHRIINWQKQHGRHDLPWQNTRNPYAIWVSEIMLQQTQVSAVIDYYQRFMTRFPTIQTLAAAEQEEVMQYWSGLGYYSRARYLHHAAQTIVDEFNGEFPQDFIAIQSLSGIGRSTAAAIAAFAFHQVHTILDGNVKRVLARLAESLLPKTDMVAYTQGLMDLGATLCTRSKPKCSTCPLNTTCLAYAQQRVHLLPTPKPKKISPQKYTTMLILQRGQEVMLEKRPSKGIWGGLWSLPEIDMQSIATELAQTRFGLTVEAQEPLPLLQHAFTHFKLEILPQPLEVVSKLSQTSIPNTIWLSIEDAIGAAIPTPVRKILISLRNA
ncbi:MAG: A/G-specific adenine glycosylase [Methylophilales bacterium 16-45-7]|nr:MAG: A/G-specific adenine glycosylase [Methylophilales bacterium 16-45-7]